MKGLGGGSLSCLHMFAGHATEANTQEAQVSHKASLRASEPPGFEEVRAVLNTVSFRSLACLWPSCWAGACWGGRAGVCLGQVSGGSGPKERCVEQHQEEQQLQSVPEAVRVVLRSRRLRVDLLRRRLDLT